MKLEDVWVRRAGLKIKSEDAIVRQLETKFSSTGLSNATSREVVTGFHRGKDEVETTDREKRQSTEEATLEAAKKEGPKNHVGVKTKGGKTKKKAKSELLLDELYDIGRPDDEQPASKRDFLNDQRKERKSVLPPIVGTLGVERRRMEREKKEEERRVKEREASLMRFKAVGTSTYCENAQFHLIEDVFLYSTMVQNRKKHSKISQLMIRE